MTRANTPKYLLSILIIKTKYLCSFAPKKPSDNTVEINTQKKNCKQKIFNFWMKYSFYLLSLFLYPTYSQADVVWEENFNAPAIDQKGATGTTSTTPPIIDMAGITKWSIDISGASLVATSDWFRIENQGLEGRDLNGEAIWESEEIDITNKINVSFRLDATERDDLEGSGSALNIDYLDVYYSVDNGSFNHIPNWHNHGDANHTLLGDHPDDEDWIATTVQQSIGAGSSLKIRVIMKNSAGAEYIRLDNIIVSSEKDSDSDGIPDSQDLDDDNDGILDTAECSGNYSNFINGSFETPGTGGNPWTPVPQASVPGWQTDSASGSIEIWTSGAIGGILAQDGGFLSELQHTSFSNVYQVLNTAPGTVLTWGGFHRGRMGTDVAEVRIGSSVAGAVTQQIMSDGQSWGEYTGTYTVPAGQTSTYFVLTPISSSTGSTSAGNLVDNWNVTSSQPQPGSCDTDSDGIPDLLDTDSDGDSCPDALEGDGSFIYSNIDSFAMFTGAVDPVTGIPTQTTPPQAIGTSKDDAQQADECDACNINSTLFTDNDIDGVGDACDLDDDNDGILDLAECSAPVDSTLDWTTSTWSAGILSNSYTINGNPISINVTDTSDALLNSPFALPLSAQFYQGGLASIDESLVFAVDLDTLGTNNEIKISLDLGDFGTGLDNISFDLFDIDGELGNFLRQEEVTINGSLATTPVSPTITASGSQIITGNIVVGVNPADPTGANSNDGTVSVSFASPVDRIEVTFKIINSPIINPGSQPGFSIYNITFDQYCDSDGDNIPNHLDTDSDNDSCNDAIEAGHLDINNNGEVDGSGYDANGQVLGAVTAYTGNNSDVITAVQASIDTNPTAQSTLVGANATFSVDASAISTTTFVAGVPNYTIPPATDVSATLVYQWQEDSGSGFADIADGGIYSGTNTDILVLTAVPLTANSNNYRVIVSCPHQLCFNEQRDAALTVLNPELTVTKTATITTDNGTANVADVNDVITFSVSVQNTGTADLDTLVVTDTMEGTLSCTPNILTPSATASCANYTYTVQQSDVDNGGTINNTASATAKDSDNKDISDNTSTSTAIVAPAPSLNVTKIATITTDNGVGNVADTDDIITFSISVQNTGNVTLDTLMVNDPMDGGVLSCMPIILAPNAIATCSDYTYTVLQSDVENGGSINNTANATAKDPANSDITGNDSTSTPIVDASPAMEITKTAIISTDINGNNLADIDDIISYNVSVENTGNVSLNTLVVSDSMQGATPVNLSCSPTILAPGATTTCDSYTYTVLHSDVYGGAAINNIATAEARNLAGNVVGSNNSSTITPVKVIPKAIPTLSEWSKILMVLLLAITGIYYKRRRLSFIN